MNINPNSKWIWIIAIVLLAFVALFYFKDRAGATYEICEYQWCEEITPTVIPTDYCETLDGIQAVDEDCPVPSETPTATPSAPPSGVSDNRNDGLGCGQHDCNTHKNDIVVPKAPPATGRGGE